MYIDKLDDTVNKYNNKYSTIKMKPVDVKSNIYILMLVKKLIIKIVSLKLVILLEYQKIKMFLQKVPLQIGRKFL